MRVGIYDQDLNGQNKKGEEFKVNAFDDLGKLLDEVDAVDIVATTNAF